MRAPSRDAFLRRSRSPAPLQCTQAAPARQRMPEATLSIASSGTVRNTRSARSATSWDEGKARAPGTRRASARAEVALPLATATTLRPERAKFIASPVPTLPAPMIPRVRFFPRICYQLYGGVACRRQSGRRVNPAAEPALLSSCPWQVTGIPFISYEVEHEKADRSPDGRRIRRHGASFLRANSDDSRARRDVFGPRREGEVRGQEDEPQESQEGQDRVEELERRAALEAASGAKRRDLPPFRFFAPSPCASAEGI